MVTTVRDDLLKEWQEKPKLSLNKKLSRTEQGDKCATQIIELLEHPGVQVLTEQHLESIGGLVAVMLDQIRRAKS